MKNSETGLWYGLDNGQGQGFTSSVFEKRVLEEDSSDMVQEWYFREHDNIIGNKDSMAK